MTLLDYSLCGLSNGSVVELSELHASVSFNWTQPGKLRTCTVCMGLFNVTVSWTAVGETKTGACSGRFIISVLELQ